MERTPSPLPCLPYNPFSSAPRKKRSIPGSLPKQSPAPLSAPELASSSVAMETYASHPCPGPAPPAVVPQPRPSPVVAEIPRSSPGRLLLRRPGSSASWTHHAPCLGTPRTPCASRAAAPLGWRPPAPRRPTPQPSWRVWPGPPQSVPLRAPRGLASMVPRRIRSSLTHRPRLSKSLGSVRLEGLGEQMPKGEPYASG